MGLTGIVAAGVALAGAAFAEAAAARRGIGPWPTLVHSYLVAALSSRRDLATWCCCCCCCYSG